MKLQAAIGDLFGDLQVVGQSSPINGRTAVAVQCIRCGLSRFALLKKLKAREIGCKHSDLYRFTVRVAAADENGCTLWTGARGNHGYGVTRFNKRIETAHRAAWRHANGDPPTGTFVLHKCDVRLCVNIEHLFLGSAADNATDMARKNRGRTGRMPYGVDPVRPGQFQARIHVRGESVSLGYYPTPEEAHEVAAAAKRAAYGL